MRWRGRDPLERVTTNSPLLGSTGAVHSGGRRTAVGVTDDAVVLRPLEGEFAVEEIPVPMNPKDWPCTTTLSWWPEAEGSCRFGCARNER